MMKLLIKVMYAIFIVLIGFVVFQQAGFARVQSFYYETALVNLEEGRVEDFVDDTMLMTGLSTYLKEPIYRFRSNDQDYKFEVLFYHYQRLVDKEIEQGLVLYVFNVETTDEIDGINFLFKSNSSNIFVETNLLLTHNGKTYSGNVLDKIIFKESFFAINNLDNEEVLLQQIKEIELSTYTLGDNNVKIDGEKFAVIKHNDSFRLEFGNEGQFVKKDGLLEVNNFTGNLDEYSSLNSNYENEGMYNITDLDKIKPYSYIITRSLVTYLIIVVISTYILFFLKPTINKIKAYKNNKKQEEIID